MAHLYEASVSVAVAASGPVATIAAGSGTACEVREITFASIGAGTVAFEGGPGRPAAAGTGTLAGGLVQALDPDDPAGQATLVTAFGTSQPTAPAVLLRRCRLTTGNGCGWAWTWAPGELVIPAGSQLVIWALQGTLQVGCSVKVAE